MDVTQIRIDSMHRLFGDTELFFLGVLIAFAALVLMWQVVKPQVRQPQ